MGLRINTNVASMVAQRSLTQVNKRTKKSLSQLSSGSRINAAADDAAGLAISEKLKAGIRGTQQAKRNANDGVSLIQTAEGGLNEVSNILIRLRELSIQSASDTVGDQERKFSDLEFQSLSSEVERIAESTKFNGKNLLNGEGESLDFQIGILNDENNDRIQYHPQNSSAKAGDIGIDGLNVATKGASQENLVKIDDAIEKISGNRANLGALQNRLQSTVNNLEIKTENMAAANSRIRDTDVALATADLAKSNILAQAGTTVLAQANSSQSMALKLL